MTTKKMIYLVVCAGMLLLGLALPEVPGSDLALAAQIKQPEKDGPCPTKKGTMISLIKWEWEVNEVEIHFFFKKGDDVIEPQCDKKYLYPTGEYPCYILDEDDDKVSLVLETRLKDDNMFYETNKISCYRRKGK